MRKLFASLAVALQLTVAAIAALATAADARAGEQVPFKGSDRGTFTITPTADPAVVFTQDVSFGVATHLGAYRLDAHEYVNLVTLEITGGAFTLTGANGDTISGTYVGTGALNGAVVTYLVSGPVTSGTGRFAGASGTLTWSGFGDLVALTLADEISGTISAVGSA
jgi:hypothetical protein